MTLEMLTALPNLLAATDVTPVNPWWSQTAAAYFGAIAGSTVGLLGGILGVAVGILAPRGIGKTFVLASMIVLLIGSSAMLFTGVIAFIVKQPYHVWYFPVLCGVIGSAVMGPLFPVVRLRYRQAEARKMDAESFKRS